MTNTGRHAQRNVDCTKPRFGRAHDGNIYRSYSSEEVNDEPLQ